MFKARLIKALQPFGLALFWFGLVLVLGSNWLFVPVPLTGAALRGYTSWWSSGLTPERLRGILAFHIAIGVGAAVIAGFITDEDLMQTWAFFGFALIGLVFLGNGAWHLLIALWKRDSLS